MFWMMENSRNIINKFVFPVFLVLLICGYVILLNISPINADYGYYVGAAKAIAHGLVPYRDISLGYSPFVFYLIPLSPVPVPGALLLSGWHIQGQIFPVRSFGYR